MTAAQRLYCLGPLVVMAAIFVTSSLSGTAPASPLLLVSASLSNFAHIPAYALLGASLCLALPRYRGWPMAALALALTFGYGVLDEWHQSFVPGREVSGPDLLRDVLGGCIGIGLMRRQWAAGRRSTDCYQAVEKLFSTAW
ncbi:VanZ family protein [Immundisolibacter sp.]